MPALREKRVVILGSGELADGFREALADFPELAPSVIGGASGGTVDALLRSGRVPHLVVLCTSPAGHLEEVRSLLHAGIDVLVEAPLATTQEHAEEITTIAERLGRIAMTAERFRVFDAVREAGSLIDAGRIGRLVYVEAGRSCKLDASHDWRGNLPRSGGGVWMAYGPDCLDLVEILAGPLERIRMSSVKRRQGTPVEDEARVEADHGNGLISRIELSWNQEHPAPIARCVGEQGEILIGWAQSVVTTDRGREVFAGGYEQREVCGALLARFLSQLRRSEPTEDRGGLTLGWIEAAYISHDSARWEIA